MISLGAKEAPELRKFAHIDNSAWAQVRESLFASPDEQAAQESIATSLVAADPTFSVFAFALGKQLSIACRQSVLSNSPSFHSARLEADAACLVFMPVMTNRRSDPRPYDWLSICIGLMNGRFLVYSLDMNLRLLICVRFAYGPVKGISITSDRLVLLYGSSFVAVDHLSLLSTIKRRHQERYVNTSETDCSTELVYEKWNALNSWKAIASAGVCRRTLWERAVAITPNASQSEPTLRKAGSFHGSYCCVGSEPFISCLRTTSDIKQVQSLINDTVNRIRSSVNVPYHIVDYVLGTSKGAPSSSVDILADRAAADVVEEDILFDDRRIGRQLIFAPGNSNLVAVSDSLGRITLWDLRQKLCIHVWKGYRDAQFGWMQVTDKKGNSSKGKQSPAVLVLAIFAPRLAVLQLWLVRRCQKIAVFKVDPHSRLLYTPPLWINKSCVGDHCSPVCLLDSSGNVFSPIVSLASCLNEDRRHSFWTPELRKHFKEQWRNELVSKEQLDGLIEMILSIHRVDDFETFMDKVFSNAKNLDCRLTCTLLESIVRRCEATAGEEEGLDLVGRRCQCMIQVVNFYAVIAALGEETHAGLVGESEFCSPLDPAVIQALNEKLSNILSLRNPDTEGTVLTLPQFLGMFTYDASGPVLKSDLSSESLASAGSFVFTPFFTRLPAHRFGRHYRTLLPLPAASWVLLLCSFWLDSVRSYSVSAEQFLCHLTGLICNQEDSEHLLDIIYKSVLSTHRIPEAVCLSEFVTAFCVSLLDSDGTVNESWETIDRRVVCWTAVCKVLRGMYVLQEFISVCKSVDQSAPRNTSEEDISLRNVLQASSDFFVEMFCRYFSLINPPASFLQTDGNEWWRPTLASLKQQFPFQFSSDSLLLNLAWQTASQWHFCFANVQLLSSVLQHLRSLSTARLRHCSSNLIWKTYCCHIARSFFCFDSEFFDKRVLEQRGRSIPFCLYQLITFCLDSLVQCDGNCAEAPQVPCEDFLYTFMCTNGKLKLAKTLLDRTNELPLANKRNVELHRQLLLTLLCACDSHSYSLGSCSALLELFPERFRGVFFKDMSVSISENEQSFAAVRQPRVSYLKALNADFVEAAPLGTIPNVELLLELCIAWDIDYDILRRQTIVLMLCNGDSQTAFQLLDVVEDHNAMADEFFQLACQFVLCRSLDGDIEISASMRSHLSSKVDRDSLKRTLSKKLTVDILERLVAYVDEVTPSDWNNGAVLNYVKKSLGNLAGR